MKYTRDQAICLAFYVNYTEADIKKYKKKKLKTWKRLTVVGMSRKMSHFLFPLAEFAMNDPLESIKYVDSLPSSEESVGKKRKKVELATMGQVKQFLNEAFCSWKRDNTVLYSQQTLATSEVYTVVKQYTSVFGTGTTQSFAAWCQGKKVDFLNAKKKKENELIKNYLSWTKLIMVNQRNF